MIKHFTPDQRRIYDEWRSRKAESMPKANFDQAMEDLENIMAQLFGGGQALKE